MSPFALCVYLNNCSSEYSGSLTGVNSWQEKMQIPVLGGEISCVCSPTSAGCSPTLPGCWRERVLLGGSGEEGWSHSFQVARCKFPPANADPVRAADNIAGDYNGTKLFALCMRPGFVYGRLLRSSCADC